MNLAVIETDPGRRRWRFPARFGSVAADLRVTAATVDGRPVPVVLVYHVKTWPRSRGLFTAWVAELERFASARGLGVYMHNVLRPDRLGLYLERRGYRNIGPEPGATIPRSYLWEPTP